MKIRNFSPVVISLLAGAAIGFCFAPSAGAPKTAPEKTSPKMVKAESRPDEAAEKAQVESDAERMRLLYVAFTRATMPGRKRPLFSRHSPSSRLERPFRRLKYGSW